MKKQKKEISRREWVRGVECRGYEERSKKHSRETDTNTNNENHYEREDEIAYSKT